MTGRRRGRPSKRKGTQGAGRKKLVLSDQGQPSTNQVSKATKYRRALDLMKNPHIDRDVLLLALKMYDKNAGENRSESESESEGEIRGHTASSAFAFYIENNFTVKQYKSIVADSKEKTKGILEKEIYPSYNKIDAEKKNVIAGILSSQANEITYSVTLQSLLNVSVRRLLESLEIPPHITSLTFFVSYGFDSSSGHKNQHQKFQDEANITYKSHNSLFASVLVLLALKNDNELIWINPTPQSIRFCRPIRLSYEQETPENLKAETLRLKQEVDSLSDYIVNINDKDITIKYNARLTLLDGKALNSVLGNEATTRCPICGLTMKYFEDCEDQLFPEENLLHGLGLLHCEIKAMEFLLHLSYRKPLNLPGWNCPKQFKAAYNAQKKIVQDRIFGKLDVHVDQVLQGTGTTNTGNVARRCLAEPEIFAECCRLNENMVRRISYVVLAFKQKEMVNQETLKEYARETHRMIYELYPWALISPSLHKLLMHGTDIQSKFELPISYYAEDAGESAHKYYRNNSTRHARQISRKDRLQDVFNYSLYASDPLTSNTYINNRMHLHVHKDLPADFCEIFGISASTSSSLLQLPSSSSHPELPSSSSSHPALSSSSSLHRQSSSLSTSSLSSS